MSVCARVCTKKLVKAFDAAVCFLPWCSTVRLAHLLRAPRPRLLSAPFHLPFFHCDDDLSLYLYLYLCDDDLRVMQLLATNRVYILLALRAARYFSSHTLKDAGCVCVLCERCDVLLRAKVDHVIASLSVCKPFFLSLSLFFASHLFSWRMMMMISRKDKIFCQQPIF